MREALGELNGKKSLFYAEFKRFGWRKFQGRFVGKTLLFIHVRDQAGKEVADHLWWKISKSFEKLDLKKGDQIAFHARVDSYTRGGRDSDDFDFHLEFPENLVKLNDTTQEKLLVNPPTPNNLVQTD